MSVLFGHPTGSPFAYNAALAHVEAARLEAFCISWMPSRGTLCLLEPIGPLRSMAQRLGRRHFSPLAEVPKVQGRVGESRRLLMRALGWGDDDRLAGEANDWLMRTMRRECRRSAVTAVHAYEDCSCRQFAEAKRIGKACIYDMPIGYYPAWEELRCELAAKYAGWVPAGQCSIRKGTPLLLEAWRAAALKRARLRLVGRWNLAESKKKELPPGCAWTGPVSSNRLRGMYREADVFVFPTNFEGRALALLEALASGLPVLTTCASGADDVVDDACGRMLPPDDFEALVEGLRWFDRNQDRLPELSRAARMNAERCSWDAYRRRLTEAVAPFV